MILVIDSNILISALIKNSKTREIILRSGIKFLHPKISIKNLGKYKKEILEKSEMNEDDYGKIYDLLLNNVELFENEIFLDKLNEANKIIGETDIEDVPFIARALSIETNGIWSDDKPFQKQDKIKIFKTEEVIEFLKQD